MRTPAAAGCRAAFVPAMDAPYEVTTAVALSRIDLPVRILQLAAGPFGLSSGRFLPSAPIQREDDDRHPIDEEKDLPVKHTKFPFAGPGTRTAPPAAGLLLRIRMQGVQREGIVVTSSSPVRPQSADRHGSSQATAPSRFGLPLIPTNIGCVAGCLLARIF